MHRYEKNMISEKKCTENILFVLAAIKKCVVQHKPVKFRVTIGATSVIKWVIGLKIVHLIHTMSPPTLKLSVVLEFRDLLSMVGI